MKKIDSGNYIERIKRQEKIYEKMTKYYNVLDDDMQQEVIFIEDRDLLVDILENFSPALSQEQASCDLSRVYSVAFHKESGALIIYNKGASLYCLSPKSETPYLTRHIGYCIYLPGLGVEFVNVGLVGNIRSKIVLRTESACTPSFLFGSQRCNCLSQWENVKELAAYFNKVKPPKVENGREFEKWVQRQEVCSDKSRVGFVLMHLDCQNGMGSGYSKNEFVHDLYARASLRHRGEYTSEQVFNVTMAGGFGAIGIKPDPRGENGMLGYKVTQIMLDLLSYTHNISHDVVFLTNNPLKMKVLSTNGYKISRLKTLGQINLAGSQEAEERMTEFNHLDINGKLVSFENELGRMIKEIENIISG